jgi:chromosome segregation ATPase
MQEAGERLANSLTERYEEVLGDGLTVATIQEISKAGYLAAQEAFLQGKSIAEAIAAGLKASDAYAKALADKAKETERLRGAEAEYEEGKKKAEDDAIKRAKEREKKEKEREKRERKSAKEQKDNLDKIKTKYEEQRQKLIELSKTGSLEEIEAANKRLYELQLEYNKALDEAVKLTQTYKAESEDLNKIREESRLKNEAAFLKSQLLDIQTQLSTLSSSNFDSTFTIIEKSIADF